MHLHRQVCLISRLQKFTDIFFKGSVVKNDVVATDIYLQKWIAADSYQSFHKHQCREQEKVEEPIKYTFKLPQLPQY